MFSSCPKTDHVGITYSYSYRSSFASTILLMRSVVFHSVEPIRAVLACETILTVMYARISLQILRFHIAVVAHMDRILGVDATMCGQIVAIPKNLRAIAALEFARRFARDQMHAKIGRPVEDLVALVA